MQLTRNGEYALRAMVYLASFGTKQAIHINDISAHWQIPENFLRKIIPKLAKAGMIHSRRGNRGGIELARSPRQISALQIIEVVEGAIYLNRCLAEKDFCSRLPGCSMHNMWNEAGQILRSYLAGKTLSDLVFQNKPERTKSITNH